METLLLMTSVIGLITGLAILIYEYDQKYGIPEMGGVKV